MTEVLLVVVLFATVSIAIYQTFSSGTKIWNYAHRDFPEEDVMIALEKIAHDWRNTFYFSALEFKGTFVDCEFPVLVTTAADPKSMGSDPYVQQIGKVRYSFEGNVGQILRQQANYGQSLKGQWQKPVVLASSIKSFSLTYFYRKDKKLVEQKDGKGVLPSMVQIDIEYAAGKIIRRMTRMIDVVASLSNL